MSYVLKYIGNGDQLRQYLKQYTKPWWLKKIIVHHTWSPTVEQWRGMSTLVNTANYYKSMQWSGGPHFFVAPEGIYQMTPPNEISVHSNEANSFAIAVEVVGDYDRTMWKDPIYTHACECYAALLEWAGLAVTDLEPHRKYNPGKSCPGNAIQMDWVQRSVAAHMNRHWTIFVPINVAVYESMDASPRVALNGSAHIDAGTIVDVDKDYGDGWYHLSNGIGFFRLPYSWDITVPLTVPVYEAPNKTSAIALNGVAHVLAGTTVRVDKAYPENWYHLQSGLGFICTETQPTNDAPLGTLFAQPSATPEQAIAYITSRPHGEYTDYDIRSIVQSYFSNCRATGIDPIVATAQMIHETGNMTSWWAARPRRNPCGFGVTGATKPLYVNGSKTKAPGANWQEHDQVWEEGYAFKSWEDGIQIQVAHLLNYALQDSDMSLLQKTYSDKDPRKSLMPASYRGCAQTVTDLNGKWAVPGTTYGQAIIQIMQAIKKS